MKQFEARFTSDLPDILIKSAEPLKNHTSFRIGGAAQWMAFPQTPAQLRALLTYARKNSVPYRILGAGTNVLAPDAGLQELIICTKDCLTGLTSDGTAITAMAGQSLAKTAAFARSLGLSGMECLHGIPGTVGGGVYMNAGAYGTEIRDVCRSVTVLYPDGTTEQKSGDLFSYRSSVFENTDAVIVSCTFCLQKGNAQEIADKMQQLMEKRRASQPLEFPSAGSTFKRPEGYFAGRLIEQAGLKGYQVGDAQVSEKHAGFIINRANASAADVKALIAEVQNKVYSHSGVRLTPEIRIW